MEVIALADIHGRVSVLDKISAQLESANLVLLVGDITHFGRQAQAASVLDAIAAYNPNILAVPGNCDHHEVGEYLTARNVNLDGRGLVLQGIGFVGLGGSLPCPGATPNEASEAELANRLDDAFAQLPPETPAILVTHQPPYDTVADYASVGRHVGSKSVHAAIEQYHPLACLTRHIHEAIGLDTIGASKIINPGPLHLGGYAKVGLADGANGTFVQMCEVCST